MSSPNNNQNNRQNLQTKQNEKQEEFFAFLDAYEKRKEAEAKKQKGKAKQSCKTQVSTNNSVPGVLLAKFINDSLKFNNLLNEENNYPKISFVSKNNRDKKTDEKIEAINQNIIKLNNQKLETESYKEVQKINTQIEKEKSKLSQLNKFGFEGENVIEINKFNFIKEFIREARSTNIENVINNIYDGELRGYLDIANKTKFNSESNVLKSIVDKTTTVIEDRTTIFKNKMMELLIDENKFKIKIFNLVFEQPTYNPNDEKSQKIYLLKSCEYMDEILKYYKEGHSKNKIYNYILKKQIKEHKEISDYASNYDLETLFEKELPEWIKDFNTETEVMMKTKQQLKQTYLILKKNMTFYNLLEKYNKQNIVEHYDKYIELCNKIKNLKLEVIDHFKENSEITILQVLEQYIYILKTLKNIDTRPDKKDGKINQLKFNVSFTKELKSLIPFKISKSIKDKINYWINSDIEFDPEVENKNNFTEDDLKTITTPNKDIYNKELYAKFGFVAGLNLPKHIRIAVGLRCVNEIFKNIQTLMLKHNNKHNFTIYIII